MVDTIVYPEDLFDKLLRVGGGETRPGFDALASGECFQK